MKTVLGYAEQGPYGGIGPFSALFDGGVRLIYEKDLNNVAAIVLWGGSDISPSLYDEKPFTNSGPSAPTERDLFEWELCRQAIEHNIPLIGVCRGAQLLCAFAGGKLIQNVTGHHSEHEIVCYTGETFLVSSSHHQMMFPYDVKHELLAWSSKKQSKVYQPSGDMANRMNMPAFEETEAVYFPEINGFAVQCHPEWHNNNGIIDKGGIAFNKWMMDEIVQRCFNKVC